MCEVVLCEVSEMMRGVRGGARCEVLRCAVCEVMRGVVRCARCEVLRGGSLRGERDDARWCEVVLCEVVRGARWCGVVRVFFRSK